MKKLPKWLKILGALGFIALAIGAIAGISIAKFPDSKFTKSYVIPVVKPFVGFVSGLQQHENVDHAQPEFTLTAGELQAAFVKDEPAAKTHYEGKVVQVSGMVSSIAGSDTNIVLLLSIENDPASNVSCQMDPAFNERMKGVASGSIVAVKGLCNGAKRDELFGSVDVLMNRCVIVN